MNTINNELKLNKHTINNELKLNKQKKLLHNPKITIKFRRWGRGVGDVGGVGVGAFCCALLYYEHVASEHNMVSMCTV